MFQQDSCSESSTVELRIIRRILAAADAQGVEFQWIGYDHSDNNRKYANVGNVSGGGEGVPAAISIC